jgi:ribosomal protein S17E
MAQQSLQAIMKSLLDEVIENMFIMNNYIGYITRKNKHCQKQPKRNSRSKNRISLILFFKSLD